MIAWRKLPRRGRVFHRWLGAIGGRDAFYIQVSRGAVLLDDLERKRQTEHASLIEAQYHAARVDMLRETK